MMLNIGNRLYQNTDNLVQRYGVYADVLDECAKGTNEFINTFPSEIERKAFSVLLNNGMQLAEETKRCIDEAGFVTGAGLSTMNAINNIQTTILDLYTGTAGRMLAYEVVAVQPITTPQAYVYYFDYRYANNKGKIKKGQSFLKQLSSQTRGYAGSTVHGEEIGTGSSIATELTLGYGPVIPGTLFITNEAGTKSAKDDGLGHFVGTLVSSTATNNEIKYEEGKLKLDVDGAAAADKIFVTYKYNTELAEANPITAELVSVPVTAEIKTLKATSTLAAVLNSRSVLGTDISDVTLDVATRELAAEIDQDIFKDLFDGAKNTITITKHNPTNEDYDSFIGRFDQSLEEASNAIFNATEKLDSTFIIAGTTMASVLMQSPKFDSSNAEKMSFGSGAKIVGTYAGKLVIKVPSSVYPQDSAVIGAKSDLPVIGAGYIYSPYIIAYPSQLISDANLRVSQGFISMIAKVMVNEDLYIKVALV